RQLADVPSRLFSQGPNRAFPPLPPAAWVQNQDSALPSQRMGGIEEAEARTSRRPASSVGGWNIKQPDLQANSTSATRLAPANRLARALLARFFRLVIRKQIATAFTGSNQPVEPFSGCMRTSTLRNILVFGASPVAQAAAHEFERRGHIVIRFTGTDACGDLG